MNINEIIRRDLEEETMKNEMNEVGRFSTDEEKRRREFAVAVFTACLWGLLLAILIAFAWSVATSDERIRKAREEGNASAQEEIDAAGGDHAWVMKTVNAWCADHGRPPAYAEVR